MKVLTELPAGALFVIALVVYGGFMIGLRYTLRRALNQEEKEHVASAAMPLMTALGALFAVLTAFTITTDTCSGNTIPVNATCTLSVAFTPTAIVTKATATSSQP